MPEGDDVARCTDEKLFQLCKDFEEHKERFEKHEQRETATFGKILEAQHENTIAIGALTGQVTELVKDTRDIVRLHRDFQGAARIGGGMKKFALWCVGVGGFVGSIGAGLYWLVEYLGKPPVT